MVTTSMPYSASRFGSVGLAAVFGWTHRLELKTFLDCRCTPSIRAGVAEWLTRWPRDPSLHKRGPVPRRQASQWALCSQGFESLPRRHFTVWSHFSGYFGRTKGTFLRVLRRFWQKESICSFYENSPRRNDFCECFLLVTIWREGAF